MFHLDISYEYISKSVDPTTYEVARECRGPFVGLRAFFFRVPNTVDLKVAMAPTSFKSL